MSEELRKHYEDGARWVVEEYRLKGLPINPKNPPEKIRLIKALRHLVGEMFDFTPEEKEGEEKT